MSTDIEMLRHMLAALAYRAARALEDAPESFAGFDGAGKTPGQIVAHMGDLFDWALSMAEGNQRWQNSAPLGWEAEKARFFSALKAFDTYLASGEEQHAPLERLFQGPVADALTHVGQLAMMRRMAECPIRGENYYVAEIETGQVSVELPAPVRPFK